MCVCARAQVQLVSDDLVEKKKGKQLAGEVRASIEHAGAEEHVAVNIENQKLVTVDSGIADGLSEYLVTNLTFSEPNDTMPMKHAADDLTGKTEADRVRTEQVPVPGAAQEGDRKQAATVEETGTPKDPIPRKKPCPIVLSINAMSNLNPTLPRTPTIPTSPGFSRNSSLAVLGPQELRQTLKKYGPKKSALRQTSKN